MNTNHKPDESQDDAIIGVAFRWSAAVIALAAVVVSGAIWLRNRTADQPEQTIEKDTSQIESLIVDEQAIPQLTFTNITEQAGITFQHTNGAAGDKLLPETMGGGVAFLDYNGDDRPDLLLINSNHWPESNSPTQPTSALYQNLGEGQFQDVTAAAGIDFTTYGMGCAVGDYDNDGDPDLFIAALGRNRLLRNDDGLFVNVTQQAGVEGAHTWSSSAGFFDYDRDGDLDLFVCNYVKWTRHTDFELNFSLNGTDRAYGPPTNYQGEYPYLYRNDGDGTFVEVGEAAGLHVVNPDTNSPVAKALAVILVDVDNDGWDDIIVANDTVQNHFFHNEQDGTFRELGSLSGLAFDRNGQATGAMGIDAGFPFPDSTMAIGVGNFANEMTSLYVSLASGSSFADQSLMEGIGAPSRARLTFGLFFFDVDLDGRQELLQTNGHLEEEINQVQPSQTYLQPAQLFWNQGTDGKSCFTIVPDANVGDLAQPIAGRGAAYADIDGDGDLDVVLSQVGAVPQLLRNDTSHQNHWLRVKLVGTQSNRDALGVKIEAQMGDRSMYRFVSPTRSYLSQVELPVTFGLGTTQTVDRLTINWPSGKSQLIENVPADQQLTVTEP